MKRTRPFPYQAKGVRKIWHFDGRALLADEMGLGKTLQSLLFAFEACPEGPIIVVCPAGLKWNWEHEALQHIGFRCHVLCGRQANPEFKQRHPIIIINYEILGEWLTILRRLRPFLIVIDECHKLGNPGTQQTKNTKRLCRNVPHVVALSGTPLMNRPAELFSTLAILRPDVFNSRTAFEERFCHRVLKPWGWQAKGAENIDELHRLLNRTCMIRRRKKDVLHDLPAKQRHVVHLGLSNRTEYRAAVSDFMGWLSKKSGRLAKKAQKAEQLVRMGYLKRLCGELKLQQVIAWIENFLEESDQKLLVFGVHKKVLGPIHEQFKSQSVLIDGSVTGIARQHAVDRFNNDKRCRLCVGNLQAAGVGWSCTSTSITAFVELGWKPGEHTQAEDRTHGIKRGKKDVRSQSYYLIAKNTIEVDLCKMLQSKQEILDGTLDGTSSDEDSLDIFNKVLELLIEQNRREE